MASSGAGIVCVVMMVVLSLAASSTATVYTVGDSSGWTIGSDYNLLMGSGMRKAVFTERVVTGLKHWQDLARSNISKNKSTSSKHSSCSWTIDTTETSISDMQNTNLPKCEHLLPSAVMSTPRSLKIYKDEEVKHKNISNPDEASSLNSNPEINEEASPKIITRETTTYDGEISFRSSWKEVGSGKGISTIASIIEEDASEFND